MKEQIVQYGITLYKGIPDSLYEGMLSIFCLGTVILISFCGLKKGLRLSSGLLMVEYVILIFCSTVFFRIYDEARGHNFSPFWSYYAIQEGKDELLHENILNVLVFLPVGVLLGCAFRCIKWGKAILIGCGISVIIEALQYFYHRGFSETDDVIHNTLGCMIGYGMYKFVWDFRQSL